MACRSIDKEDCFLNERTSPRRVACVTPTMILHEGPLSDASGTPNTLCADKFASKEKELLRTDIDFLKERNKAQIPVSNRAVRQPAKVLKDPPLLSTNVDLQLELRDVTIASLEAKLKRAEGELQECYAKLSASGQENQRLKLQNDELQEKVYKGNRSIENVDAKCSGEGKNCIENVESVETLTKEKKKMMKYIVHTKRQHDKEINDLKEQLATSKCSETKLSERLSQVTEASQDSEKTAFYLRSQLENTHGEVSVLRNRLSQLEVASNDQAQGLSPEDRSKLLEDFKDCVRDFKGVSDVIHQMRLGEDLDMSLLLGVDPCSPKTLTTSKSNFQERLTLSDYDHQLQEIEGQLRNTIQDIREKLSEHYAENVGLKSGCISQ